MFKLRDLVLEWNEFESLAGYSSEPPASIHPNPPHFLRNLRPPILQNLRPPFHCGNFGLKNVNWDFLYFHCMPLKKNVGKLVTLWNIKNTSTLENIRSKFPQCIHRSLRPSPTFLRNLRLPFVGVSCHRLLEPPTAIPLSLWLSFIGTSGHRFFEIFNHRSSEAGGVSGCRLSEPPVVIRWSLRPSFIGASGPCSSELPAAVSLKSSTAVHWSIWPLFVGVQPSVRRSLLPLFIGVSGRRS